MRRLAAGAFGLAALATLLASWVTLAQSPFAAPFRDRTEAELKVAIETALTRDLNMRVVEDRIRAALDAGEADEASAVMRLADNRGIRVPENLRAELTAAEEAATGWSACLACAIDPADCPDLTRVAACNLPLELTPVGDAKAVYGALDAWLSGEEVDRIDLSLGVIGLAATAAIVTSVGTTATAKSGATLIRVARRTGAMAGPLADEIAGLAAGVLRMDLAPDVLRGARALPDLVDPAAASRLSRVAADVGRLSDDMPLGDAFAVLRHAESTEDLARIARVANAAGGETRGTLAVLGKARALRLTTRLTDMAMLAAGLLAALAGQVVSLLLWALRRMLRAGGQRPRPRAGSSRHTARTARTR